MDSESVTHVERLQLVNYVIAASVTLMIYDYCLTLVDEVYLIWNAKLHLVEILYFLSRYPTFLDVTLKVYTNFTPHIRMSHCVPTARIIVWLITIGIGVAELILIFRTFALWSRSMKVLYVLLSLFTAVFVPSLAIIGIYLRELRVIPPPYPSFVGCNITGGTSIIFFNFVMLILLETVIMGMTAFRVYKKFRGTTNPLISTLYRDGILFFLCLFAISLSNVFVLSLGPSDFQDLMTTFQRVMHSLLSCRIIIHARRTDRRYHATSLTAKQIVPRELPSEPAVFTTVFAEPDISVVLRDHPGSAPTASEMSTWY